MTDLSQYIIPTTTPVVSLDCKKAFVALTKNEKRYAHYLSQACWDGGLICLVQCSPESPLVFILLTKIFKGQDIAELEKNCLQQVEGLTAQDFLAFKMYAASFFSNFGNYKSFGDTKFIPEISKGQFEGIMKSSKEYANDPAGLNELWSLCGDAIFSLSEREKELGLGEKGTTTYFSSNCGLEDAELAKKFMTEKGISAYNTRLFKCTKDGQTRYEVRLASAHCDEVDGNYVKLGKYDYDGVSFEVTRGDYNPLMSKVVENLRLAQKYAANDNEMNMLEKYISSFSCGSLPDHMEGSKYWIRDKGPIIESYIGFIETYRDPFGVRGEWEGFVAMVNKEMSAKFSHLVSNAEQFLPKLPWPRDYEKDRFLKPDFTSLDVLSFASSGIPAGINIPNYDDIRQNEGFKNVSLGNVLAGHSKDQKVTFLDPAEKDLFTNLKSPAFEVQVGLHELLGHGSGKLFAVDENGTFNFDKENVRNAVTGGEVTSWYQQGETWDSKFPVISSSYEECRAECVGLYLSLERDILKIFGHEGEDANNMMYINWLNMVRAGVLGLEFYTPETTAWRQAHMQARFVILRVLLEAGQGLVTIKRLKGEDGEDDAYVLLDKAKIETVGKEAIGNFLKKLQVYKSTADYEAAKAMYMGYSEVNDNTPEKFLSLRKIVLARKQPRRMFVQALTHEAENGDVELKEYDASVDGLIQSFIERYAKDEYSVILKSLWKKDQDFFSC